MINVMIILKRLNDSFLKQRVLIIMMVIQNVILSLIVLMYANMIISNGRLNGEIDYIQVRFFYNLSIVLLSLIICAYSPFFLSNTLNKLYENNIIEHLLSVRVSIREIVFAVFLRGIRTLMILLISTFPIISISFYFGGFSIMKIIRLLIILIMFAIFISSICIYISSMILDKNVSLTVAYVISFVFMAINLISLNRVIVSFSMTFLYLIAMAIISLILLSNARNTVIFNT